MHDPNTTPQGSVDYFSLILALLFGLWGGVARYLNEVLQEKRQFHFFELWVSAMVSGFCGVLIGLLALHFAMEAYLVMFGAGMAGGIGWQRLRGLAHQPATDRPPGQSRHGPAHQNDFDHHHAGAKPGAAFAREEDLAQATA